MPDFRVENPGVSAISLPVVGGTPGSVLFVGAGPVLAQDNSNLFWDNTNKRFGIGTTNPGAALEVVNSSNERIQFAVGNHSIVGGIAGGSLDFVPGSWTNGNITFSPTGVSGGVYMNYGGTASNGGIRIFDGGTTQIGVWQSTGNVGIGVTGPTAVLHLKAGTATASTAPLKFTAGTLLSAIELGALEFTDDGTNGHLYITRNLAGVLTRTLIV